MCVGEIEYCGRCHQFTESQVFCECIQGPLDKDPRCKNATHEHHDPLSPLVISHNAIRDAEEALLDQVIEEDAEDEPPTTFAEAERAFIAAPGPEERDHCLLYGCVWVKAGEWSDGLMCWGPVQCMRCGRPAPDDIPFEPVLDIEAANTKADPRILEAELEVASLKAFAAKPGGRVWGYIVSNSCQKILDILSGKE